MKKAIYVLLALSLVCGVTGCRKAEEGEVYNEETVEDFAEAAGVSVEFAQSLNDAVGQVQERFNRTFDISDVYNFRETDEWASGKRYTIWLAQEYVLTVYEQNDEVVSIRTSDGGFAYSKDSSEVTG